MGAVLMAVAAAWPARAAESLSDRDSVELTVYNQDFALVKEHRRLALDKGLNHVDLEGVAALLDPTSVHVKSLSAPDALRVLEQNYEFDLVNYGKLLQKYIGQEIEMHELADQKTGEVRIKKARLLSSGYIQQPQPVGYGMATSYAYQYAGQPLYEIDGKIYTGATGTVVLPSLPEGLILKPTLNWHLESAKAGEQAIELSYMTSGIKWVADYVALVNPDDAKLDLTGWVTLDNRSGAAYENAKLKLMAGDVNVVQPAVLQSWAVKAMVKQDRSGSALPQFQEKSFFEYHLYTLRRPTTITDSEIKQVEFTSAAQVPVIKRYVYDGLADDPRYQGWDWSSYREQAEYGKLSQKKVAVMLEFKNSEANHLGMPLPKGRIRVYKADVDGGQEFVGEDLIDHTPKDEQMRLLVGNAFDLVGERKQTDFKILIPGRMAEESFEISLRNHKAEDVAIVVREHLYRGQEWEIRQPSLPFQKQDAQTVEFIVPVPKDNEVKLTYTVQYRY